MSEPNIMWIFVILLAISDISKFYLIYKFSEESERWTNKFIDLERDNDKLKTLLKLNNLKYERD